MDKLECKRKDGIRKNVRVQKRKYWQYIRESFKKSVFKKSGYDTRKSHLKM